MIKEVILFHNNKERNRHLLKRLQLFDSDGDSIPHLLDIVGDILCSTILVTLFLVAPVLNDRKLIVRSLLNLLEQLRGLTEGVRLQG